MLSRLRLHMLNVMPQRIASFFLDMSTIIANIEYE